MALHWNTGAMPEPEKPEKPEKPTEESMKRAQEWWSKEMAGFSGFREEIADLASLLDAVREERGDCLFCKDTAEKRYAVCYRHRHSIPQAMSADQDERDAEWVRAVREEVHDVRDRGLLFKRMGVKDE